MYDEAVTLYQNKVITVLLDASLNQMLQKVKIIFLINFACKLKDLLLNCLTEEILYKCAKFILTFLTNVNITNRWHFPNASLRRNIYSTNEFDKKSAL